MRKSRTPLLCLVILLAAFSVSAQSNLSSPEIKVEYDRFKDTTSVALNGGYTVSKTGTTIITFDAEIHGQKISPGTPEVGIIIVQLSDDWIFLNGPRTLRVLLNGKDRETLGNMERKSAQVVRGGTGVLETLLLPVPFKMIQKLSASVKIEMQVGAVEFQLNAAQIKALQEFVSRFN
jgi:hypothetical protein